MRGKIVSHVELKQANQFFYDMNYDLKYHLTWNQ